MKIRNKTILITGANRGIGRALLDEGRFDGGKESLCGNAKRTRTF
jgi:NAD(P)-dependent dehydrogenase (short-subunit alcohol dehydrogenase family)